MSRAAIVAPFACLAAWAASAVCNPIVPEGEFFSDPAGRVGPDGALYLFGSRDECTNWYCSCGNDLLSTRDMVSWELKKDILRSRDPGDEVDGTDTVLFAPDGIFVDGKWHLMFCTPDTNYVEGVACADSPEGPFGNAKKIPQCTQIDPSIWQDADGTLYYTWGQFSMKMAKFLPGMDGIDESTIAEGVIDEQRHYFHEGSQIFRRNGIWYLAFADISRRGRPTSIGYATADKPFGPYTYRGVIIDNYGCDPEVWNNHGSVVEFAGRWYVFYHRSTNGSVTWRKACVEPIEFDENGLIAEVEMTSNGAGAPLDPFAFTEGRLAATMGGNARIETFPGGEERLARIMDGDKATWRYFAFGEAPSALKLAVVPRAGGEIALVDGCGGEYARATVAGGDGAGIAETVLELKRPFPAGDRQAVRLEFAGEKGKELFDIEGFAFTRQGAN